MATVNKDFKIKSGLIVEGTTATVNGYDILTKKPADDQYIIDIIGGETLVKSVSNEFDVSVAGELSLDRTVVDAYYDAAGSASYAQDAAESFATAADTALFGAVYDVIEAAKTAAEATAQGYANDAKAAAEATASSDATSKANAAQAAAELTASNALSSAVNDLEAYADQAEVDAKAYTDTRETAITTAYQSYADTAEQDAKNYADQKVADLVDSAPALLDTLNELAAAIGDDANFAANLATSVGEKVAKAGDTMTGALTLSGAPTSNLHAATKAYVDSAESNAISTASSDATSKANAAQAAAEATASADATSKANAAQAAAEATASADATSKANTAESNAIAHADALTTDDVAEGTTQYFTDGRAKSSAIDLLTGSSTYLTNIQITSNLAGGLNITAENGVADSTTDDLTEGATNKYFSNSLALGAIQNSNIQPSSIDITWVRRENATWTDVPTASQVVCHQAGASEGSMKYLVRVTASVGGTRHSHVTELLATVDGSNGVAVVEYGTIYTSENPLATATVLWNGLTNCYELNVTTANNNSEVMVAATMLASLD